MDIEITAGGVYSAKGEEVPVGTVFKGLDAVPEGLAGRHKVLGEGKTLVVNPAQDPTVGGAPYEARPKEESPGWYQVYDSAGVAVGKAMRQTDADSFNAMSDEDKAEFVAADV